MRERRLCRPRSAWSEGVAGREEQSQLWLQMVAAITGVFWLPAQAAAAFLRVSQCR